MRSARGNAFVLLLGLLLAFGGGLLAWLLQTDCGAVDVDQVRLAGGFGRTGSSWPGAFVNGFWVTASIVASQAPQVAL